MNAQLTAAVKVPGTQVTPDARLSPEAGGFQTLFATASQGAQETDAPTNVSPSAGGGSVVGEPAGASPGRAARKKPGQEADGVLSGLAAALAIPISTAVPFSDSEPSESVIGRAGAADRHGSSGATDTAPLADLPFEASMFAAGARPVSVPKEIADAWHISPAKVFAVAEGAEDERDATESRFATRLPAETAAATESAQQLTPSVQTPTRSETRNTAASATHAGSYLTTDARQAAGGISAASDSETVSRPAESVAVAVTATAKGDGRGQVPAKGPLADGKRPDRRETAGDVSAAPTAKPAAGASPLPSTPAVEAMDAEGAARQRRGQAFEDPKENDSGGDGSPVAVHGSSSPPFTVQAATQAPTEPHSHSVSASPSIAGHPETLSALRPQAAPVPAPPVLQTTQVLQRMDKAEIRIGLQSTDFGAIRLHTTVANDQVGAVVNTSHPALRDALLVEAPSLERAIARHSLRLDSVSVDTGSANSNFNSFGSNEREQPRSELASTPRWPTASLQPSRSAAAVTPALLNGGRRLDVRA